MFLLRARDSSLGIIQKGRERERKSCGVCGLKGSGGTGAIGLH